MLYSLKTCGAYSATPSPLKKGNKMSIKYVVTLKYFKFPTIQFTVSATSEMETVEKAKLEAIKEHPQLNGRELLQTNILIAPDPD